MATIWVWCACDSGRDAEGTGAEAQRERVPIGFWPQLQKWAGSWYASVLAAPTVYTALLQVEQRIMVRTSLPIHQPTSAEVQTSTLTEWPAYLQQRSSLSRSPLPLKVPVLLGPVEWGPQEMDQNRPVTCFKPIHTARSEWQAKPKPSPQTPSFSWKICLPWNQSLMPKRLGIVTVEYIVLQKPPLLCLWEPLQPRKREWGNSHWRLVCRWS